jgi:tetratricopeptide (TPR) repeat protein
VRAWFVAALVCVCARAWAADDVAAKAHYQAAQAYFDQARFADAIREYEESYRLAPYPAILYREGICLEQLGRYGEAADMMQKFLDADPKTNRRAVVEASIERLRARAAPPPTETPPPPVDPSASLRAVEAKPAPVIAPVVTAQEPRRRPYLLPGLVLGGAVAVAVVGAGLIGSVAGDYNSCARPCSEDAISSMQSRAYASYAMFGVAGALAIVDVVLWVRAAKQGRAPSVAMVRF